jgi:hypothetical protein
MSHSPSRNRVLCEKWIVQNRCDVERFSSVLQERSSTNPWFLALVMSARKSALTLPLPLQFLAAWLAVWLERVLQAQVDYLGAENRLLRERLGAKRLQLTDAAGQALGEERVGGSGYDRVPRDDSALVPRAGGQEVRLQRAARVGVETIVRNGPTANMRHAGSERCKSLLVQRDFEARDRGHRDRFSRIRRDRLHERLTATREPRCIAEYRPLKR